MLFLSGEDSDCEYITQRALMAIVWLQLGKVIEQ